MVIVGVIVIVGDIVEVGEVVGVEVDVTVGVSVANIAPSGLPGLASQTTNMIAPRMTNAPAP
jgi:hypothetical protein